MQSPFEIRQIYAHGPVIVPSMLLCDFGDLEREIRRLEDAGFATIHLDVMDGVFVPNFSYGLTIVEAVRRITELPLDVHLMMVQPQKYVARFREAGADMMTFHAEAVDDVSQVVAAIRQCGAAVGIAINPATTVDVILPVTQEIDVALIMTVQAGFGGQSFQPSPLDKIARLRSRRPDLLIEVDGGINETTIGTCAVHGADIFVVGSAIFSTNDYRSAKNRLRSAIDASSTTKPPETNTASRLHSESAQTKQR